MYTIYDSTISGWGGHGDTIWIYYDHYKSDTMFLCPIKKPMFCDEPEDIKKLLFVWNTSGWVQWMHIDTIEPFTTDTFNLQIFLGGEDKL